MFKKSLLFASTTLSTSSYSDFKWESYAGVQGVDEILLNRAVLGIQKKKTLSHEHIKKLNKEI